jgi:uncharacterized protein (TIGR03083 family)
VTPRHLDLIRAEGTALGRAARIDPTRPVPRYPGWSIADLVVHVGSVHRRTLRILVERAQEPVDRVYPDTDEPDELLAWYDDGLEAMTDAFAASDLGMEVWGLVPSCNVGWWQRRMAVETSIHRWDAQSARGPAGAIDGDLAVEAIDEFGQLPVFRLATARLGPPGTTLTLLATDQPASWRVVQADDGGVVLGRAELGDDGATISGTASDLYLDMVGRTAGSLSADGDLAVIEAWRSMRDSLPDAVR